MWERHIEMTPPILRAPYPYFGGKRRAASLIWEALGDVDHYIEPFCGSAAVLLSRPSTSKCETVNDACGFISNFWRSVKAYPELVTEHSDWPVNECDLHARHQWLLNQRESLTERLIQDPEWCDPKIAGWWVWGAGIWIGDGWCRNLSRKLPRLGDEGGGVHATHQGGPIPGENVNFETVLDWMQALSNRLRRVRVACGDWQRVVNSDSTLFPFRDRKGAITGIYLDPPYSTGNQDYSAGGTGTELSQLVAAWAKEHGKDPRCRIVLSGYEGDYDLSGWKPLLWRAKGGYGVQRKGSTNENSHRECLWLSPYCLGNSHESVFDLF